MQDIFIVRDLDTMKALSDPRRVEILGLLQKPRTTRQVADVLGETANAMYYHILEMEKFHLIEVVKTAMKGHMQEKYYQAAARFYTPAADLYENRFDPYQTDSLHKLQNMQEAALKELHKAAENPQMEELLAETGCLLQKTLHLSSVKQAELRNRLFALIQEYEGEFSAEDSQTLLTLVLFPVSQSHES